MGVRVVVGIIITGFPESHHRGVDVIIRRVGNRVIAFETTVMNEVDDAPQVAVRRAHDSRSARTFHRDDRRGGKKSCVSGKDRRRSKRSSHPLHTEERRRRDVVHGGGRGCSNPKAPSISAPACAHLHRSRAEQPRPRRPTSGNEHHDSDGRHSIVSQSMLLAARTVRCHIIIIRERTTTVVLHCKRARGQSGRGGGGASEGRV